MSETGNPYGAGTGSQRSGASGREGGGAGTDTGVKERVSEAASHLGDAGRETAQDAKERARDVAHEASDRARGLVDRTRSELGSQVESQQQHLAGGLRALGDELNQMAGGTQDPGYASDLVQRAGEATGRAAQWFEERKPTDVLHEVEDFARRRPGVFIALAAGAGLVVGRFLRGAKDASGDGEARDQGASGGASGDVRAGRPSASASDTGGNAAGSTGSTGSMGGAGGTAGTDAGARSGTGPGPVGSGAQGGEPDIGRSGAFPAMSNDDLPQDPNVPTSAGETPPAFPPPAPDGTRPQTTGGEHDVQRP